MTMQLPQTKCQITLLVHTKMTTNEAHCFQNIIIYFVGFLRLIKIIVQHVFLELEKVSTFQFNSINQIHHTHIYNKLFTKSSLSHLCISRFKSSSSEEAATHLLVAKYMANNKLSSQMCNTSCVSALVLVIVDETILHCLQICYHCVLKGSKHYSYQKDNVLWYKSHV